MDAGEGTPGVIRQPQYPSHHTSKASGLILLLIDERHCCWLPQTTDNSPDRDLDHGGGLHSSVAAIRKKIGRAGKARGRNFGTHSSATTYRRTSPA